MSIRYAGNRKPGWQNNLYGQDCRKLNELGIDSDHWQLLSPKAKERYLTYKREKAVKEMPGRTER